MSTLFAPAAAFVNVSVFSDHEIIANIEPIFIVHMIILETRFELLGSTSDLLFIKICEIKRQNVRFVLLTEDTLVLI